MIDTGVNVNVCDNQNKSTPLHLAVNQDNEAGVKTLLSSSNCNVNCQVIYHLHVRWMANLEAALDWISPSLPRQLNSCFAQP